MRAAQALRTVAIVDLDLSGPREGLFGATPETVGKLQRWHTGPNSRSEHGGRWACHLG